MRQEGAQGRFKAGARYLPLASAGRAVWPKVALHHGHIEVALERYEAPAGSLVLLPAGVPHQEWNDGPGVERHLEVLSPAPREGTVWDRGVDFAFNGVQYSGQFGRQDNQRKVQGRSG